MAIRDVAGSVLEGVERGAGGIDEIAQGNLGVVTQSEAWIRFLWFAKLIMWFLIAVVVAIIIYHFFFRFNKKVLVKKLKGTAVIDVYMDRGRIVTDSRQKIKLSLLRTRKTCPVPEYSYTTKMGKLDFYELYLDGKGNLYPRDDKILIDQVTGHVKNDSSVDFHILSSWRLEEMKLAEEKFKKTSFLTKHMPEIMVFMAMIVVLGMVWITMKGIESAGVQHAMAIQELARSLAAIS